MWIDKVGFHVDEALVFDGKATVEIDGSLKFRALK